MILDKFGLEPLLALHNSIKDEKAGMALNRALNIFGVHDFLHFSPSRKSGIRILALDGGGTRALVTLEVLKKIEETTGLGKPWIIFSYFQGKRIIDMFDLIIGTSTGAVLASLVGIRGYTLDKCETLYKELR